MFRFLAVLDPRVGHTMNVQYFFHLSLSSVILTDSSTESPVHVLMLSIQVVRGLPRLCAPGLILALYLSPGNSLVPHGVTILC